MTNNLDASTRRRVKLYMLNEDRQWDDKGTGHVSATLVESNSMALVVISETDGTHLLESKIQTDTAYQKQQETLIVWSEGDNVDLALSFQEKTGCDDIWEKICNVQGKDPSVDITQDLTDDNDDNDEMDEGLGVNGGGAGDVGGFNFPPCDLAHLGEIAEMFGQVSNYPIQRERIACALERSSYLRQLVDVFHKAEDLDDERALHALYEIMRAVIQFNRRTLFEVIFSDEMLLDVVGMLEYNPRGHTQHRRFLESEARLKQVMPLPTPLINKIQTTYRVQYIQDNCLPPPSLFDEQNTCLNSYIYINKVEIVTKLHEDPNFLPALFVKLLSNETSLQTKLDLLGLFKEFASIVNTLQPQQKETLFTSLCQNRALKSVFVCLSTPSVQIKSLCLDILQIFVDNQPSIVREFFVSDASHLNLLISHLIGDPDSELSQGFIIMFMLRLLLDPDNMASQQRNEKQEFLNFFYRNSIEMLVRPIDQYVVDNNLICDDNHTALILQNVCELLAFCVEQHSYHMKNFVYHNHILLRVVVLFKSRHQSVVTAALRVIRKFLGTEEELNYRYLIRNNIIHELICLLDRNRQYNMLSSALLELFEFIRSKNIATLVTDICENYWDTTLKFHSYVRTFIQLKDLYDERTVKSTGALLHPIGSSSSSSVVCSAASSIPSVTSSSSSSSTLSNSSSVSLIVPSRRHETLVDVDEQWYDQDDDDMTVSTNPTTETCQTPQEDVDSNFIERIAHNKANHINNSNTDSSSDEEEDDDNNNNNNNILPGAITTGGTTTLPFKYKHQSNANLASTKSLHKSLEPISINIKTTSLDNTRKKCDVQEPVKKSLVGVTDALLPGLVDYDDDDDDDDNDEEHKLTTDESQVPKHESSSLSPSVVILANHTQTSGGAGDLLVSITTSSSTQPQSLSLETSSSSMTCSIANSPPTSNPKRIKLE